MNYTEHLESDLFDVTAERDELLGLLRRWSTMVNPDDELQLMRDTDETLAALKRNGETK